MDKSRFSNHILIKDVKIDDAFWSGVQHLVRENVIPYQYDALNDRIENAEKSYCIDNFKKAQANAVKINNGEEIPVYPTDKWHYDEWNSEPDAFKGWVFQESDLYKWLEAVAFSLANCWDDELFKRASEMIDLVCSIQLDDGYLNALYITNDPSTRLTNLKDFHELYCFGHLAEAAVAFYNSTGERKLLDAACRYADFLYDTFGEEEGKKRGYGGHEIAEMALVKLYRATGEKRYLDLASFFINERGQKPFYFDLERNDSTDGSGYTYNQAHKPVREQTEAVGHAVRAVYLYSGMTDIARFNTDDELYNACKTIWNNIAEKKLYITGGIGSTVVGEAFTFDYDLPNDLAYCETCASIGLAFFAQRMLEIEPNCAVADVMERAMYNCILSGMSENGKEFFYVNPLEVLPEASHRDDRKRHVKPVRQKWYDCACCPPNLARFLNSIGEYCATENAENVFVHQYIGGDYRFDKADIKVKSCYAENGEVSFDINPKSPFKLALRIPSWCADFDINAPFELIDGYAYISVSEPVKVCACFTPEIKLVKCSNLVRENVGKIAVVRGPFVYCAESIDNGENLQMLSVFIDEPMRYEDLQIVLSGFREHPDDNLYSTYAQPVGEKVELRLIPYYKWANRGENEMTVYLRPKNS